MRPKAAILVAFWYMKSLTQSKTFWKAVVVGVVGIVTVALTELDMIGYIAIVNAVADVLLRMVTSDPIR